MYDNPVRPRLQTILLVDDTPTNLRLAVDTLQAYDYRVLVARTGESGIERAERSQPDLILLDVGLPGIDGFETCRRLKANRSTSQIPVIFATALSNTSDKVAGFDAGGVDFVTKPVEERELLARVRAQLQIRDLQLRLAQYAELLENRSERLEQAAAEDRAEVQRLSGVVREQATTIREVTGELAGALTDGEPTEGLRASLLCAHLEQAMALLSGVDDERAEAGRSHIAIARELCEAPKALVRSGPHPFSALSAREREIAELTISGYSTKEIAYELGVARSTVSTHRARLMEKLGIADLPQLIKLGLGIDR